MIKLCMFDLDGTLIDSVPDLANSINLVLAGNNLPIRKREDYACNMGKGLSNLIKTAIPEELCTEELFEKLKASVVTYYSEHCTEETVLYEGIAKAIKNLETSGIKLAVITNKPHTFLDKIIKDLLPFVDFTHVIGAGEYPNKPDPSALYEVMKETGAENKECIYVGDTDIDIRTAINAKVVPVGVSWGYQTGEALKKAGAKYIIEKPEELLKIVLQ